ncbi:MAG TPA: response regulator [Chloroflexi bacterium]|nr:response regulator [Chloroflexota bacterium]
MTKILVAEDERDIRELIAFTLSSLGGFEIIKANNGEEAVEKAREEIPDLILLDVRMPKMTGYEACSQLKADPLTQNIPIVFLSAKGQEAEIQQGLELGAEEYILKPFDPGELVEKIRAILRRVQARRAEQVQV